MGLCQATCDDPRRTPQSRRRCLEARGEGKTGNKAWLRRRLHAAIVRSHLDEERRERHADLWGSDDSDMPE